MEKLTLSLLPGLYGVCRFEESSSALQYLKRCEQFISVTIAEDETSLVCSEDLIPPGVLAERGFRALKISGPLAFSMTGVLSSLLAPLSAASVSVFSISTYDTDYIFVKQSALERSVEALRKVATVIS